MSNARVTFTKTTMIMNVFLIPILWGVAVSGMNCCTVDLDVQLTVECVNGLALLEWETRNKPIFGYDVNYGCSSNVNCNGGTKKAYKTSVLIRNNTGDGAHKLHIFATNISNTSFGNSMCWFWVKNKDQVEENEGCSIIVTCNPVTLIDAPSSVKVFSPSTLLTPFLSSSVISSVSIPRSIAATLTEVLPTVTATVFTAIPTIDTVTVYGTTIAVATDIVMATPTPTSAVTNTKTTTPSAVTNTKTTTAIINTFVFTTTTSVYPSPSGIALFDSQQNRFQDVYSIMIYIVLCCTVIVILLLVSICLFAYWRKRKRRQLENYHIEDMCSEDPGELAKESDSDTETLANGNGIGDDISITDDDMYMLRKILRLDILSLEPSIFTDNEADDGSVASHYRTDDGGVDCSHYCGSGGHCLQSSNASSSHHRSSSCSSVF